MQGWSAVILGVIVIIGTLDVGCTQLTAPWTQPQVATATAPAGITFVGDVPPWADTAAAVMAELENWRGLPFTEAVQVTFQPQTDPNLNGWYNSATKELVVTVGESHQLGRGVLLHELFHALQDQSYGLLQLHLESQGQPDYDKAVTAMIEGEAMLAVSELLNYDFLAHARLPVEGPISEDRFEKIFLYGAGLKFISAVREAGGWQAVTSAFQDPPRATALILDPERYLAGERDLPEVAIPLQSGESLQNTSIKGEYEVQLLLARSPETRPLLDQLSDRYEADTVGFITGADGVSFHRWVLEFDSPEIAAALAEGVATALESEGVPLRAIAAVDNILTVEW